MMIGDGDDKKLMHLMLPSCIIIAYRCVRKCLTAHPSAGSTSQPATKSTKKIGEVVLGFEPRWPEISIQSERKA